MKKNGRTPAQDLALVLRGLKEFGRILPRQMVHIYVRGILAAAIPLLTTALSARIINELTSGQNKRSLLLLCLSGAGLLFLLSLWRSWEDCKIAVGYSRLFTTHEIRLTGKSYRLPYGLLEKSTTRELRDQVSGSIGVSGAGMASLYWDMDVFFTNSVAVLLSLAVFFPCIHDLAGNAGQGEAVKLALSLAVLVALCSFLSCKMTGKRFDVAFEVFQNGAKHIRYGDFYTMNYLSGEHGAMDARIYGQEALIVRESQEKCYEHFARGKEKELRAANRYDGTRLVCSCICGSAVYLLIGRQALRGHIGCGSILLIYGAATTFINGLSEVAQITTDLRNNNEHLTRYFEYMDLPEEADSAPDTQTASHGARPGKKAHPVPEIIRFEDVSFRYPGSEDLVLHHLNLEIRAGERLALVGENGSGKTTLVKLLCRLYRPTKGRILLNGRDIWSYPYADYIACISTVFQDFSLFAFSLAENVAAAREYEEEKVLAALKMAGLEEKVGRLELGIKHSLFHDFEETGTDLSGGEAQKAAIARAVYKDAPIMILDEPTAALDPYAEYEIYKNFGEITRGKTVLSISHRLSSCRMCHRIVVMSQGTIRQCGTHEELLREPDGKYSELWNAQAQYYS